MFSWRPKPRAHLFQLDVHSHLIPGIDDGPATMDISLDLIRKFSSLGYTTLVTTPHIHPDFYPNTPEIIMNGLAELKQEVGKAGIPVEIHAAAEYYVDDRFFKLLKGHEELMSINNHILVETSYLNKPVFLREIIFELQTRGLTMILAHPERYLYFHDDIQAVGELIDMGVWMQINAGSLCGLYSREVKRFAEKLISRKFVHLLGTDCHNMSQLDQIGSYMQSRSFQKLSRLDLKNNQLLDI